MPLVEPSRILLIRPSALGDVCRTVPALVSLRRRYPTARIDWLVRDAFVDAVRAHPDLNGALSFPRTAMQRWWTPTGGRTLVEFLRAVAAPQYDLVIDCQGLFRSGVFAFASGAPRRFGDRSAPELAWLAYTDRVRIDHDLHVVDRMLAITTAAGAPAVPDMRLHAPPDAELPSAIESAQPFAVLAPTSAWPGKCWPADRFAQLAAQLLEEGLVERIVVVGGANERAQIEPLAKLAASDGRVLDLVGRTTIGELMRMIEHASLVVANDSAAVHMAVGFHRPLVALLGPTDARLAGPYQRMDAVVQVVSNADELTHRACKDASHGAALMERITVELAMSKAREQLERKCKTLNNNATASESCV